MPKVKMRDIFLKSKSITSEVIMELLKKDAYYIRCLHNHPLLTKEHIDYIVETAPWQAAEYLHDHLLLTKKHIDYVVETAPGLAAKYLHNHSLLTKKHIDYVVETAPWQAATYLKDNSIYKATYG